MHELGLTQQLVDLAVTHARGAGAARVTAIDLVVGALSGVDAEAISFCFELVARGTLAEGAALRIEHEPIEIECRRCRRRHPAGELELWCQQCEAADVEVVAGRSFRVRSLEVE
jgi:hydrogenase nickel incorporation protein HypA/HybF